MNLNIGGLCLGFNRGGGGSQLVTPTLPQVSSIVRAWSIRRLIDSYGNQIVGLADRKTPLPGTDELSFTDSGKISIASGLPAYIYELNEQSGNAPLNTIKGSVFEACPEIYNATLNNGMKFDGGDMMTQGDYDSALETIMASNYSVLFFFNKPAVISGVCIQRVGTTSGYFKVDLRGVAATKTVRVSIRNINNVDTVTDNFMDGNWHSIGISVNNAGNVNVLLDGIQIASFAVPVVTPTISSLAIGGNGTTAQYTGYMNDIIFWSTNLTNQQLADAHTALRPFYPTTGV